MLITNRAQKFENKFRSYSIPDCLNGRMGTAASWQVFKKISQLKSVSNSYIFVSEDDGRYYNMNSWILLPDASQPGGISTTSWCDPYMTIWHNGKSNLAYADGHVERHEWSNETRMMLSQEKKEEFERSGTPWGSSTFCQPQTSQGIDDLTVMARGWAK